MWRWTDRSNYTLGFVHCPEESIMYYSCASYAGGKQQKIDLLLYNVSTLQQLNIYGIYLTINIKHIKQLRYLVCHLPLVTVREGGDCREAPMFCLSKCLQGEGAAQYEEELPMEAERPPDTPRCMYTLEGSPSSGVLQLRAEHPQAFLCKVISHQSQANK